MYPILGHYGPFLLYSYTVVLGVGVAAGISVTAWGARRAAGQHQGVAASADWFDAILVCLAAGLVGGRIGFVWGQWTYFQERPSDIWRLWQGGLSYHGALLAGLLALWGWCSWRKRPFLTEAGLLSPAFALVNAFGWLACWLEGCAYGGETVMRAIGVANWLAGDLPDSFGVHALRYQTQLLGLVLSLLIAVLALFWRRHLSPGSLFGWTLFGISFGRVFVGLLRGDAIPVLDAISLDTLLDAALAAAALLLLQYLRAIQRGDAERRQQRAQERNGVCDGRRGNDHNGI